MPRAFEAGQDGVHAGRAGGLGQHELILGEAAFAVHPVPMAEAIEGIEERLVMDEALPAAGAAAAFNKVDRIEQPHQRPVQQKSGHIHRHTQAAAIAGQQRALFRMLAQSQQGPAEGLAAGQAIHPCDGIDTAPVLFEQCQRRFRCRGRDGPLLDRGALNPLEAQFRLHDDAGQPHAAAGGVEQFRAQFLGTLDDALANCRDFQSGDMAREAAL